MLANILGIIAGILALGASIPYVHSIIKGRTKPSHTSWGIWSLSGIILFSSYFSAGAEETLWLAAAYTIYPIVIFFFALKYGVRKVNQLDIYCLCGALIGLLLWILTNNPTTALYINVAIGIVGVFPTIKNVYFKPESEDKLAWTIAGLAGVINLFSITSLEFEILVYPIATLFINGSVALLLLFPRLRTTRFARK